MDLILLIALSIIIAGKFRKTGARGASKYILGMIGAVLACELMGLMMLGEMESFVPMLLCMLVGVILVVFIFRAGVKKAVSGEQSDAPALAMPKEIRASAIVCAIGSFLTGTFGWLLTSIMSNRGRGFFVAVAKILNTHYPVIFFFVLMGIGTLVLAVGFFMMALIKKPCGKLKITSLFCAFSTLAYSAFLFFNAVSYIKIYVTVSMVRMSSMHMIPFYIPLIIVIITIIAVLLHLASLYERLGKAGRVLAAIAMAVFGIVLILDIYTLIVREIYFSWYGSSVVGYWLFAITMLAAAMKKEDIPGEADAKPE